jgi:redox-sensitive bicupin YhaK (pirin superfamily)
VPVRKIKRVSKSTPTLEGAGVHLKRAFGYHEVPHFDPFLLLDDFRADEPSMYIKGFPWHPHRGIETITYVLEGDVEHGDSLGNGGVISSGDVQWMTAGNGILHQEMPKGDKKGRMYGFQLWANLPASQKMMNPRYRDVKSADIPHVVIDDKIKIKIVCGTVNGVSGPVKDIVTDPEYLDITLEPGANYAHHVQNGYTAFAYVIAGKGYFCNEKTPFQYDKHGRNYFDFEITPYASDGNLVLFDDGDQILMSTDESAMRLLLCTGKPLKEPVAWYGPIVMNTQEELEVAFREFENGTFIKKGDRIR